MSSNKRKSSRSPEGSSNQRKVSKALPKPNQDGQNGAGAGKQGNNASLINPSADPRKRAEKSNATVQSPASTDGSAYQDATSSRSTPQPAMQQQGVTKAIMATAKRSNEGVDLLTTGLQEPLSSLNEQMSKAASLRLSYSLAKQRLDHAQAEHKNMEEWFKKFPAVQERTTKAISTASKEVSDIERQLQANADKYSGSSASLSHAIRNLASHSAIAPQPSPEMVTREEYDILQDRFAKQVDLLDKHQDRLEKQQKMIETLQKTVQDLGQNATRASDQSITMDKNITSLADRMRQIEDYSKVNRTSLNDWTEKSEKWFDHIRTTVEPKLDSTSDEVTAIKSMAEKHTSDVGLLNTELAKNKTSVLSNQEIVKQLGKAVSKVSKVHEDYGRNESRIDSCQEQLEQLRNETRGHGNGSALSRLSKHDEWLSDLQRRTDDLSVNAERVARLENEQNDLAQDVQTIKDRPIPATQPLSHQTAQIDEAFIAGHVDRMFATYKKGLDEDNEKRDNMLGDASDAHGQVIDDLGLQLSLVREKIEDLDRTHNKRLQTLDQSHNEKHTNASAACTSINNTLITLKSGFDTLQTKVSTLSETVKAVEKRPSQTPTPAPTAPTPVPAPPESTGFRPLPPHPQNTRSPRITGSPQVNGAHPPNHPAYAHGGPNGVATEPAGSGGPTVYNLQNQINGIVGLVQSLRQRCDNLTTEEVVRSMVDQMSKMYPAPKDFQLAIRGLSEQNANLDGRLTTLSTSFSSIDSRVTQLRQDFSDYVAQQAPDQRPAEGQLQKLADDVTALHKHIDDTLQTARKEIDQIVDAQTDTIVKVREQSEAVRRQVAALERVAFSTQNTEDA